MSDSRQHAENPLAIGERRQSARTPVSPQAFVKFGANNYGFVFNISETGLVFAPTGTLTLAVGAVAKMRFLLPESRDWIETSGEVAWIAGSQKEAGVRFVNLADDTREKIRNWISQEPSRAQPARKRVGVPDMTRNIEDGVHVSAASGEPETKPGTFVDEAALNSILADPAKLLREAKSVRQQLAPQYTKTVPEEPPQKASSVPIPERRSHVRRRVLSLEYIDLGSFNGGILLNLSEGGMYVQAVAGLSGEDLPEISFRLPDSTYIVKTSAQLAWTGESKKDAGMKFVNLPEEARLKIREWVALEHPPLEGVNKPETKIASPRKKNDRLIEMPAQSKKAANFQEAQAGVPQRPDVNLAQPVGNSTGNPAAPSAVELLHLSGPILQTRLGDLPKINNAATESAPDVSRRSWRGLAAAIVIVVLLSFVAGWIVAGPGGRKQFLGLFSSTQNQASTSAENGTTQAPTAVAQSAQLAPAVNDTPQQPVPQTPSAPVVSTSAPDKPPSAKPNGSIQPLPSLAASSNLSAVNPSQPQTQKPVALIAHTSVPPIPSGNASRDTHTSQPLASNTASGPSSAPVETKTHDIPLAPQPSHPVTAPPVSSAPAKEVSSPAVSNASSQPPTTKIPALVSNASPAATQPSAHADSSPVVSKPPALAEVVKGTVSVSASPFPSIRVPPEMKSQISKQGASLQLGQLISRVEPVYPEDAEHQRIEGVVKLHVIIDRDGTVQNVDQMTGPPLLIAAAANAVRQWRYKPTSLGGQPVEAGVDVTVVFRLQITHPN